MTLLDLPSWALAAQEQCMGHSGLKLLKPSSRELDLIPRAVQRIKRSKALEVSSKVTLSRCIQLEFPRSTARSAQPKHLALHHCSCHGLSCRSLAPSSTSATPLSPSPRSVSRVSLSSRPHAVTWPSAFWTLTMASWPSLKMSEPLQSPQHPNRTILKASMMKTLRPMATSTTKCPKDVILMIGTTMSTQWNCCAWMWRTMSGTCESSENKILSVTQLILALMDLQRRIRMSSISLSLKNKSLSERPLAARARSLQLFPLQLMETTGNIFVQSPASSLSAQSPLLAKHGSSSCLQGKWASPCSAPLLA